MPSRDNDLPNLPWTQLQFIGNGNRIMNWLCRVGEVRDREMEDRTAVMCTDVCITYTLTNANHKIKQNRILIPHQIQVCYNNIIVTNWPHASTAYNEPYM